MTVDRKEWLYNIGKTFGVPTLLLLLVMGGAWFGLSWTGREIIIPLRDWTIWRMKASYETDLRMIEVMQRQAILLEAHQESLDRIEHYIGGKRVIQAPAFPTDTTECK